MLPASVFDITNKTSHYRRKLEKSIEYGLYEHEQQTKLVEQNDTEKIHVQKSQIQRYRLTNRVY